MLTIPDKISNSKSGKRILLVDDEPDVTMLFSMVLNASNGFDVYSFNDPLLALSNFKPGLYDLAILDIKMPKMNGFELYAEMKKKDSKIRACFITATDKINYESLGEKKQETEVPEDMTKEYCTLNKDMFLQKPISNKDLLLEINKRIRE
jgi:two-component system, OmpR family, response regulator ChvI